MINRVVIACCFISFFTISFAAQRPQFQQPSKPYLERIPVDQLDNFVHQAVLYKVNKHDYQNVILAENLKGTTYCTIYTGESRSRGIVCKKKQLYKRNSEAVLPRN